MKGFRPTMMGKLRKVNLVIGGVQEKRAQVIWATMIHQEKAKLR